MAIETIDLALNGVNRLTNGRPHRWVPAHRQPGPIRPKGVTLGRHVGSMSGTSWCMAEKLNDESIEGWLGGRSGWKRKADTLVKDFWFPSFRHTIVFLNRVASLADEHNHHPDIDVRYHRIRVTLTTHDVGGLTQEDLALGKQIDFATGARYDPNVRRPSR